MGLELIPFLTALIGSSIAAIYDLKTTEVPDEIPLTMILIAVSFYTFQTVLTGNFILRDSLIAGLSLLAFGMLMYFFGQWGGADALILSSIGFLLPAAPKFFPKTFFPFPLTYLINSFFVGAAYMLLYSLFFSIKNRIVISKFFSHVKASAKLVLLFASILFIFLSLLSFFICRFYFQNFLKAILLPASAVCITVLLYFVLEFAKCVEKFGFRKKILVSKLKVGDVLLNFKQFRGIRKEEIEEIKKSGRKYVWIKFGVPYALTFPLTLILTFLFGDFIPLIGGIVFPF
jgi:Flp pilus assembly protein protease CpaA